MQNNTKMKVFATIVLLTIIILIIVFPPTSDFDSSNTTIPNSQSTNTDKEDSSIVKNDNFFLHKDNSIDNIVSNVQNGSIEDFIEITKKETKTTRTFETYLVLTFRNISDRTISDVEVYYRGVLSDRNMADDVIENSFPRSVNLGPGKETSINIPSTDISLDIIKISKIRFEDGTVIDIPIPRILEARPIIIEK
ncbi:MAG: hypothetical protein WCR42_16340 [bacterium]